MIIRKPIDFQVSLRAALSAAKGSEAIFNERLLRQSLRSFLAMTLVSVFFVLFSFGLAFAEIPNAASTTTSAQAVPQAQVPAPAQPTITTVASTQPQKSTSGLTQRIALDLRDTDIGDALKFLAMKGNINIIISKDVSGRATLYIKDVMLKDALDILLLANNLAYEKRGDILYVMTEAEFKLLHGSNFKDARQVKIFSLRYAKPEAVFKTLELIKSDIGKLIVDEESGTVVIMDTPEKIAEMKELLVSLDQPVLTKTFPLQYAKAKDVFAALTSRIDAKKTGSITVDEKNNQVIISALPERIVEAEALIKGMDKKTKQVLLEAKILKIVLKDDFDMGVDWDQIWSQANLHGLNIAGAFAFPTTLANYFRMGIGNDVITGQSYSTIVKMLQEFGETRNLSSPSIAVLNGQEAKIMIGRTEAYVTTTIATGSTTSSTAAQVQFIDVGVQLVVTPTINDEGYVSMRIKPEISSVDDSLTYKIAADVDNTVPLISKTTAETSVMVRDGRTIIIGGLRKDEKLKTVDKWPILGDIPFLGNAFRKTSEKLEKSEIVVFITPKIISGENDVVDEEKKPKDMRVTVVD